MPGDYKVSMESFNSTDAKKQYFLNTEDLEGLPYETFSFGWGTGRPSRFYECAVLEEAARRKHGVEGLENKRRKRAKREENQRKKQEAAEKAAQELLKKKDNENDAPNEDDDDDDDNSNSVMKEVVVDDKTLKQIRKDIKQALKPLMTWDHLRSKSSPNGCAVTAQVPRVQQEEYASLIGRPYDPQLKTLVKTGAWYSTHVAVSTVMGSADNNLTGSGGRYGCNSELGIDPNGVMMLKYRPSTNTLSITAYVRHVDTFGYHENDDCFY